MNNICPSVTPKNVTFPILFPILHSIYNFLKQKYLTYQPFFFKYTVTFIHKPRDSPTHRLPFQKDQTARPLLITAAHTRARSTNETHFSRPDAYTRADRQKNYPRRWNRINRIMQQMSPSSSKKRGPNQSSLSLSPSVPRLIIPGIETTRKPPENKAGRKKMHAAPAINKKRGRLEANEQTNAQESHCTRLTCKRLGCTRTFRYRTTTL